MIYAQQAAHHQSHIRARGHAQAIELAIAIELNGRSFSRRQELACMVRHVHDSVLEIAPEMQHASVDWPDHVPLLILTPNQCGETVTRPSVKMELPISIRRGEATSQDFRRSSPEHEASVTRDGTRSLTTLQRHSAIVATKQWQDLKNDIPPQIGDLNAR